MPYLSDAQRDLLSPTSPPAAVATRNGLLVPTTNAGSFLNAACWAWALVGEYENVGNPFSANTIYTSDEGAFVFDENRIPTALNNNFFQTTDAVFPDTVPYHTVLSDNFAAAVGDDQIAQDRCRVALMTLTAIVNGHTVLDADGSDIYTMVMNTNTWYGWDHWGIGIKGADSDVISYQQTVTGTPLRYNCNVMWDEHQPLITVLRIDGLLQTQIDLLNLAS